MCERHSWGIAWELYALAVALAALFSLCAQPVPARGETATQTDSYVPQVVLVQMDDGSDADDLAAQLESSGIGAVDPESVVQVAEGMAQVSITAGTTVEEAVGVLDGSGLVEAAQPDYLYTVMADDLASLVSESSPVLDDPLLGSSWGIHDIGALTAQDMVYGDTDFARVSIAIIDVGFSVEHEDLWENVVSCFNAYRASQQEEDEDLLRDVAPGPSSYDHGNHVAGIVAATGGNGHGTVGVARKAGIVPIRVYNYESGSGSGATTSAIARAYDYVIANSEQYGIRVVNMSLGMASTSPFAADDLLLQKIDEAYEHGIVTVCSAGNASPTVPYDNYPADYDTVVSVMNLQRQTSKQNDGTLSWDANGEVWRASSSNYNAPGERDKNIAAPGTQILSTTYTSSGYGFGEYGYLSGTSMASPFVAGVLGLMFAARPSMSSQDAVTLLYESARDLGEAGWDEEYGYGEVDACAAIRAVWCADDPVDGWKDLPTGRGYVKDGALVVGWATIRGGTYYFGSNGAALTGWQKIDDSTYWFFNDGRMATSWATVNGSKWLFRENGALVESGWGTWNGFKYYAQGDAGLATGWQTIAGERYYFRPEGDWRMAVGWVTIDGKKCLFREDGRLATGWVTLGDAHYYTDSGLPRTGWQDLPDGRRYFRPAPDYRMATGWAIINGQKYEFKANGELA